MLIPGIEDLIAKIPQHTIEPHEASRSPLEHYRRGANDAWNLLLYFERSTEQAGTYPRVAERHARRLSAMLVVALVESFERFAKELVALCVDHVATLVLDDRIDKAFGKIQPRVVGAHFAEKSVGRALAESSTWLSSAQIDDAFGKVLANESNKAWQPGLFPQRTHPRARTLDTLFQLRHSVVHNVSLITRSDAAKLQVLTRAQVAAPRVLSPSKSDVLYVKSFLDETANWVDGEVEKRLIVVLTALYQQNQSLFLPQTKADELAKQFRRSITICGATANP